MTLTSRRGTYLALVASVAGALFALVPPLGASGLLEPRELGRAELARQVASGAHAWRSVDLGTLSSAVGFRLFGLHEWAGRLPLALWAIAGVVATYGALARLVDRRTGVYAAMALATMPLYLEGARTMVGSAVAMSAFAMALGGLAVLVFAEGRRIAWIAVALAGLVAGGASAGALVGVAVPLVSVGLAWALVRSTEGLRDRVAEGTGLVALAAGLVACVVGTRSAGAADAGVTFDRGLADAAAALAPWSAFLPFAAGRLLAGDGRGGVRALLILACAATLAADTWSAAHGGSVPFVGGAAVAAVCAIALRDDEERGTGPSLLVVVGTALLALVLRHDVVTMPAKGLAALGADGTVPDTFAKHAATLWTVALAVFAAGLGLMFLARAGAVPRPFARRRVPFVVLAALASALVLGVGYYPALAGQLSARGALLRYARVHRPGEPLALLGVSDKGAAFTIGEDAHSVADPASALAWLDTGRERRFLAVSDDQLLALNQLYRARSSPRANLPILDATTSHVLLAVSMLEPGETNENPLDRFALSAPPAPMHPVDASLEDKVEVLGFDLVDGSGRPVHALATGRPSTMRVFYRVDVPPGAGWQAFLHIDGNGRRYNGDHPLMDGKYPPASWLAGDLLADSFEVVLPPNFTRGAYRVYFGIFAGDRRLKAVRGAADSDGRVDGGEVRVE